MESFTFERMTMYQCQTLLATVFLSLLYFSALSQADTSTTPEITSGSVETESMGPDFVSLSLTDSTLYRNFETESAKYRNADKNVLITVAPAESAQRLEFIVLFYKTVLLQHEKKKNITKAYQQSLKQMKIQYGRLDFKSKLFLKEH